MNFAILLMNVPFLVYPVYIKGTVFTSVSMTGIERTLEKYRARQISQYKDFIRSLKRNSITLEEVAVLRIWVAFEPEKLQDIDGDDLFPLPNTEENPYLDTLLNDSKNYVQVFLYDGKGLSEKQIAMFEDLHKQSRKKGGRLFVLNYQKISQKLRYASHLLEVNPEDIQKLAIKKAKFFSGYSGLEPIEGVIAEQKKGRYVDLQRMIVLYNMDVVFSELQKKYPGESGVICKLRVMLYADFDRKLDTVIENALIDSGYACLGIKVISSVFLEMFGNMEIMDKHCYEDGLTCTVRVENNAILCTEKRSKFLERTIEGFLKNERKILENEEENIDFRPFVDFFFICIFKEIENALGKWVDKGHRPGIGTENIGHCALDIVLDRNLSLEERRKVIWDSLSPFLVPVEELEGTKDKTWGKDMNSTILKKCHRTRRASPHEEIVSELQES